MPCIIKCSTCGFKFFNDKEDITSPADILRRYSFKCPSCLSKLTFDYRKISISIATDIHAYRRPGISMRTLRIKSIRERILE
ncbi:MAG: hypothetical protein RQ952_02940 [Thermoproteota archaeon]|nr:hypothetical protein [Thermoproteota archaeon]